MPLPTPRKDEDQSHYVSRCISFETKASPGRDPRQIQAMCFQKWKDRNKVSQSKEVVKMKDGSFDIDNVVVVNLKYAKVDTDTNVIHRMSIMSSEAVNSNGDVFRRFSPEAMNDALTIFNGAIALRQMVEE